MRCNFWVLLIVLFSSSNVFSQEKYIQHTVSKGETVSQIAQQYHIKSTAIYELNPDAKKGLKLKSVLLIPLANSDSKIDFKKETSNKEIVVSEKRHIIQPKETLYGIAKLYNVTVDDLYKINSLLKKTGLRKGGVINIPIKDSDIVEVASNKEITKEISKKSVIDIPRDAKIEILSSQANSGNPTDVVREVFPKETKYAIAREYGITIAELEKANPLLQTEALKVGQKLVIPVKEEIKDSKSTVSVNSSLPDVPATILTKEVASNEEVEKEYSHEVLPKETKYGIAKEFGLTVNELEAQNPSISKKLLVGQKLTIRTTKNIQVETPKKEYAFNNQLETENSNYDVKSSRGEDFIDELISTASENIGVRYRTGGTTKEGFDCSGLMYSTFGIFDIQLPRTSFEQSQYGVKINNEDAQKGDLIFFKTNGRSQINHVGMVVEVCDGDIRFIHASVGGGVIISSVKEKYYSKRITQINRVL